MRFLPRSPEQYLVVILLFTLGLRCVAIDGPLVFDDLHSVEMNSSIKSFENIGAWFTDGQSFSGLPGLYGFRPLVLISLAFDHWLGGGDAWAFHLGNLLKHLLAVALVFLCARLLLRRVAGLDEAVIGRAACIGALLFAVHPMHTETIQLASSRSEILATIGTLIALAGWLANSGRAWRQSAWLAAGTAFALLAKLNGLLVPCVVGLVELVLPAREEIRGRLRGTWLTRVRSWVPLAASLPVIFLYLRARAPVMAGYVGSSGTVKSMHDAAGRPYLDHLEACTFFVPKALWCWIAPFQSTIDHAEYFQLGWQAAPTIAGVVFIVLCLGYGLWCHARRPLITLAVFGSFGLMLPWIVVRLNMPLAEHRLYPVAFFWGLPLSAALARLSFSSLLRERRIANFALASLAVVLTLRTFVWSSKWREGRTLWLACLEESPQSFFAWANLAMYEQERGAPLAAVRAMEKAHALHGARRAVLVSLLEHRLSCMFQRKRDASFVAHTERRVSDLSERGPDRFRGPMHYAEFAAYANDGANTELSRFGEAWGLSMRDVKGRDALGHLYAGKAARAGARRLEAEVILRHGLMLRADQRPSIHERAKLLTELCHVYLDARNFVDARRALDATKASYGPSAEFEVTVLELEARFFFERGNKAAFERQLRTMTERGHDDVDGFAARLRRQSAAKPN